MRGTENLKRKKGRIKHVNAQITLAQQVFLSPCKCAMPVLRGDKRDAGVCVQRKPGKSGIGKQPSPCAPALNIYSVSV